MAEEAGSEIVTVLQDHLIKVKSALQSRSNMDKTLKEEAINSNHLLIMDTLICVLLILASQRIETVIGDWFGEETVRQNIPAPIDVSTKRGAPPSIVECFILAWVCGLIWSEVKQLWDVGLEEYANDMWNVQKEMAAKLQTTELPREDWDTWDPMLISEGLFSAANIFSSLKLVYIFSVNPYLGPLQVSLSRMVLDIMKFFFLYVLVLFAFSCGLNQLLWYYADMEKQRCPNATTTFDPKNPSDPDACIVWRRFANLFETTQTLFWAVFGLIDLDNFELAGIKSFTRFWGMLMFGTYSVINIVVLLNLLIAMMNHSYQLISVFESVIHKITVLLKI
ncbi:Transient receptor potential-gamma protein [Blattella germanica]|nr:Transient receptor potential-gamma protein [Blattella germanica]